MNYTKQAVVIIREAEKVIGKKYTRKQRVVLTKLILAHPKDHWFVIDGKLSHITPKEDE